MADDISMAGKPMPSDILESLRAQVSMQQLVEPEIPVITSVTASLMEDMVENAMAMSMSQHENAVNNNNSNCMLEIGDSLSVGDSDSECMPKKDTKKKNKKKKSPFDLHDDDDTKTSDPKDYKAEPAFFHKPSMTTKQLQAQSQAELNEIFVLYGVDPASIKQDEIPRPLPDWSVNDSRWKTDIVQRKEEEEEQQQKVLLDLASSRTNLDISSSRRSSSKKSKKKKKEKSKQGGSSLLLSDAESSVGWSEGTSSSEDSDGLPKARRQSQRLSRRANTDEGIERSMKVDDFDALPPLTSMNNSSARRKSRLSPPPPKSRKGHYRSMNDNSNSSDDDDDDPLNSLLALSASAGPVDERKLMAAAQRTMACLDNDALTDLQTIVVENGTPAATVDELVAQSPSGSFLVMASKQGEFYSLEPATLADFVRSRL